MSCDTSTSTKAGSNDGGAAAPERAAPALTLERIGVAVAGAANAKHKLLAATITVDQAARIRVQALRVSAGPKEKRVLPALPGSKINGVVTGRKHAAIWYDLTRAGRVRVQLRLPPLELRPGRRCALSVVATNASGGKRTLTVSFRTG